MWSSDGGGIRDRCEMTDSVKLRRVIIGDQSRYADDYHGVGRRPLCSDATRPGNRYLALGPFADKSLVGLAAGVPYPRVASKS
jgi:hypothetical protein